MRLPRLLSSVALPALLAAPLFAQPDLPPDPPPRVDPPKKEEPKKDDKASDPKAVQAAADKKSLDAAGLKADDAAALVKYLKARTLPDAEREKIEKLIGRMNIDAPFDERLAAQEELLKLGGSALAVAKKMSKESKDPETVYRARECERLMEKDKTNNSEVLAAVVRALGTTNSPEAVAALFAFLPLADSPQLIDGIQEAMTANAGKDGKPVQLLVDALTDASPVRRRVAAVALTSGGTVEKRVRFPDVYAKVLAVAKEDKDPGVRFAVTRVLITECREKEAVGMLCDLLPDMTRGQSWQAEDLLLQLAGKDAPKERCKHAMDGSGKELAGNNKSRQATRDAWKKWWDGAKVDLTKADFKQTLKGELVVVWQTYSNGSQGVVAEYGADGKERNRLAFAANNGLADALVRPDGKIVTVEHNIAQIVVRDFTGKALNTFAIPQDNNGRAWGFQPKNLQLLDNGNVVAFHANGYAEVDKDGKKVANYTRPEIQKGQPQFDVSGGARMKDGTTVLALNTSKLVFVDEKGKDSDKKAITTGPPSYRAALTPTGDDKVLLTENQRLIEYDLKTGKAEGFKADNVYNAQSACRLPNGNVLYTDTNQYPPRLVEKTATGEEVWSKPTTDQNANILRAFVK